MSQIPLKIFFRDMEPSLPLHERIRERATRFERFARITSCEVVVEAPHQHHHKGKLYSVRIRIFVPQGEIVIDRAGPQDPAHEDVYVALRDAFDAAERRLEQNHEKKRDHRRKTG